MKKPYGDGCLHADEEEQGASLRPPDLHQLTVMNAPEKHDLDAGAKKRKKREAAEDELPRASPSFPSFVSAAGMKKPYGDGCLHAYEEEQGASLRPPDLHQLTVMNAPEKHDLDARAKKRKKREAAEDELPRASPSFPSFVSAAGMKKPYGDGCFHAYEEEQGASLRPPDLHQLMVMNAPEKHDLDAGAKKRKKREAAEDEEEEEDRERKRMLQGDGGGAVQKR